MTTSVPVFQGCVSEHARVVFRVFLLEQGAWVPVSPGFDTRDEALTFAGPLAYQHNSDPRDTGSVYSIREVKMWLS